ncbi:MAG: heme o synthase [Pirellulaceae bacterium]|jgi:protoheme IX farnesyltransferase|nr:heme o synthase [Pirellulaceae bacterium]MDP7301644.1 heme o synthase [Pirellulaceae bacterium]HJN11866.1 heme o synthase [Pirellulaceae bacterium]
MSTTTLTLTDGRTGRFARLADYFELAKPRIAALVLVAVAVSYSVALWGQPNPWILLHLLFGTALVATSASTLNQWLERNRDALMPRTADRPLAAGRLGATETIVFACLTIVIGVSYLAITIGLPTAGWAGLSWLLYVWVYTPLKTRTSLNTVIGAIPGALPVLIGWSASGAALDLRAASLFLVVFVWQFPHFMAIAWIYRKQYEAAGMKMLTVVDPSGRWAGVQAMLAALVLIPVSVVPVLNVPGLGGFLYAIAACVLGFLQLSCAIAFFAKQQERSARRLLLASLVYLPALLLLLTIVPWV